VDDLLSEKEQIEQLRTWWSVYGGYVIFGVAAGAILLFGFNYYQNSKLNAQLQASSLYQQLTDDVVDGKLEEAEIVAGELAASYEDTPYAAQAKLAIARLYMDKNRDEDAADALRDLLASDSSDEIKNVARLRLAKILLYQDKPTEVIDLLEGQDNTAFAAVYGEVIGDAYVALGQYADAEAAYQGVLMDPLSQGTVNQRLVQWKALDLPAADTAAPEPQPVEAESGDAPGGEPAPAAAETANEAAE
jgi:predicted negative regulator of RcsB-dependent stress response